LKTLVVPGVVGMAQCRVKYPTLAIIATPCQREISVVPIDSGRREVNGTGIEREQHVDAIA
jgi:hypothetical protein